MTIRYDGTNYHGWQVQKNALAVQPVVQDSLCKILKYRPDVTGCSRTDSGVHAQGYCFHFDYTGRMDAQSLVKAMNTVLPDDIAAIDCRQVPDDFHARYAVKSKVYRYRFYNGKTRDPFYRQYAQFIPYRLDEQRMRQAAQAFVGTHDFAGFCAAGSAVEDTVRTVMAADVWRQGEIVTFQVEADGFLYNMVRIMAGTLLYVSQGKIDPADMKSILLSKDRKKAGPTAPACGLCLYKVNY